MLPVSSSEFPKVPTSGELSKGRRKRGRERRRGGGGGGGGGGQSIVEKTESLWMERMESLDSVGLYLILVSRRPMSNMEKGTAVGDNPTHTHTDPRTHTDTHTPSESG